MGLVLGWNVKNATAIETNAVNVKTFGASICVYVYA